MIKQVTNPNHTKTVWSDGKGGYLKPCPKCGGGLEYFRSVDNPKLTCQSTIGKKRADWKKCKCDECNNTGVVKSDTPVML